jgi:16S rRNA U516 pseudouridylate synthase RsuA-like enzyme
LKRIEYGNIAIGELPMGSWRYVNEEELNYCKSIIKTWDDNGAGWNKKNQK